MECTIHCKRAEKGLDTERASFEKLFNLAELFEILPRLEANFRKVKAPQCMLYPHQQDSLSKMLKAYGPIRYLLADCAGAGKTVTVGFLLLKLIERFPQEFFNRTLVLTPARVREQFKKEWEDLLGLYESSFRSPLDFKILSHDSRKIEEELENLRKSKIGIDCLVVDECHLFKKGEIESSKRTQALEKLARQARHLILMSGTANTGQERHFRFLLSLLDDKKEVDYWHRLLEVSRRVRRARSPEEKAKSLRLSSVEDFYCRHTKEMLSSFDGAKLLKDVDHEICKWSFSQSHFDWYNRAVDVLKSSTKNGWMLAHSLKIFSSSTSAAKKHVENALKRLQLYENYKLDEKSLSLDKLKRAIEGLPKEDRRLFPRKLEQRTLESIQADLTGGFRERKANLEGLLDLFEPGLDFLEGKKKRLLEVLEALRKDRLATVIFTCYHKTEEELGAFLKDQGENVFIFREDADVQKFLKSCQNKETAPILISTDKGAVGLNLQAAAAVIHYDLPYDFVTLEQRNGRVYRLGQKAEVCRFKYLLNETTRDSRVFAILLRKAREILRSSGGFFGKDAAFSEDLPTIDSEVIEALTFLEEKKIREAVSQLALKEDETQVASLTDGLQKPQAPLATVYNVEDAKKRLLNFNTLFFQKDPYGITLADAISILKEEYRFSERASRLLEARLRKFQSVPLKEKASFFDHLRRQLESIFLEEAQSSGPRWLFKKGERRLSFLCKVVSSDGRIVAPLIVSVLDGKIGYGRFLGKYEKFLEELPEKLSRRKEGFKDLGELDLEPASFAKVEEILKKSFENSEEFEEDRILLSRQKGGTLYAKALEEFKKRWSFDVEILAGIVEGPSEEEARRQFSELSPEVPDPYDLLEIEARAFRLIKEYEREQGRRCFDVSTSPKFKQWKKELEKLLGPIPEKSLHFDLWSVDEKAPENNRRIEVKAHTGERISFISSHEFEAFSHPDSWLYVVNLASKTVLAIEGYKVLEKADSLRKFVREFYLLDYSVAKELA